MAGGCPPPPPFGKCSFELRPFPFGYKQGKPLLNLSKQVVMQSVYETVFFPFIFMAWSSNDLAQCGWPPQRVALPSPGLVLALCAEMGHGSRPHPAGRQQPSGHRALSGLGVLRCAAITMLNCSFNEQGVTKAWQPSLYEYLRDEELFLPLTPKCWRNITMYLLNSIRAWVAQEDCWFSRDLSPSCK